VHTDVISLYSGVGSITATQSRGGGIVQLPLTTDLPVTFVRVDKPVAGNYPSDYTSVTALNAAIGYSTNRITFVQNQLYPADGGNARFIGWYPQGGTWNATNRTVAFGDLDGTTDILASTSAEGSKSNLFTTTQNKITFNHVLTQIRVFIYLENTAYQSVWGSLTGISIAGKKQTCTLTLPLPTATVGSSPSVAFGSSTTALALQKVDNSGAVGTQTLTATVPNTTTDPPIGYAMFAPHTSSTDKLVLNVVTTNGGTQTVEIPYKTNAEFASGKSYDVVLKLQAATVSATADITNWTNGGTITENL